MTDHSLPFSPPMIRALLDLSKTETRRVLVPQPEEHKPGQFHIFNAHGGIMGVDEAKVGTTALDYQRYAIGDRIWVREHWRTVKSFDAYSPSEIGQLCLDEGFDSPWCPVEYLSDGTRSDPHHWTGYEPGRFRPGMYMPRWASRLTLKLTNVRVERVQDISEADAIAEGVRQKGEAFFVDGLKAETYTSYGASGAFRNLWKHLNDQRAEGAYAWDRNPWVTPLSFTTHFHNIDEGPDHV